MIYGAKKACSICKMRAASSSLEALRYTVSRIDIDSVYLQRFILR